MRSTRGVGAPKTPHESVWEVRGSARAQPLRRSCTRLVMQRESRPGETDGRGVPPARPVIAPSGGTSAGLRNSLRCCDEASRAERSARRCRTSADARRGRPPLQRVATLPRRRGAGAGALGDGVAVPRRFGTAGGGLGRGKAPSCSSAWSARTPTLTNGVSILQTNLLY